MISPRAIEEYLARPTDNFHWLKNLPDHELDEMLAAIRPLPQFNAEPLNRAQKIGFIIGVAYPYWMFHLEMGTGKTRLTLELLRWRMQTGKVKSALVLVSSDVLVLGWRDEILRWGITEIPHILLLGSSQEKWERLKSMEHGIAIATHTGFSTMVSKLAPSRNGGKQHYQPLGEHIAYMRSTFPMFVLDESTRVGSHQSLAFKVCKAVMSEAKVRYALAGRLFGRDLMPVWAQFYLVDQGESFGSTLGMFREVFFKAKRAYFGGMEYTFNPRREEQFHKFLSHRSIYISANECTDLPEMVKVQKHCQFPQDTQVYYKKCVADIIAAKRDVREMQNAFLRMRQISSGFVGVVDDELEEKSEIEFPNNPKLDLLVELLQELPAGRKAVVFHEFMLSGRKIAAALTKSKVKFGKLDASTKDWDKVKNKFNNGDTDVLVVSWKKGGYGLNLQAASYCFFYETPVGAIDRDQCERRIWRQGQKNKCFIYDLVMKDSMDAKILDYHNKASNLFEAIVKDPSILG
jgi:hypothetical protein